jgi:2-keto-4-pentenoate hydratase/2-oxohepta-3-ene-1,7-dioic acid hydratase in catechol pathway
VDGQSLKRLNGALKALAAGDEVVVRIEGIGTLTNSVEDAEC